MEINLKQLGTQAVEASTGTKKMRLSENATSMVFQLFTKNIYSNPIGTVVREITSNCFDSHVEAKVKAPVLIKKSVDSQTGTIYISFIDYGVGMSPDRVENIYGVYFESTKRCDNTQIGGFGIGGKTPLAYKRSTGHGEGEYDNSFYVITVFNKMKYFYLIFEGEESPVISLLHSEATTEGNGTEVRIPVLEKDLNTFAKEMVRQLYYFENVIFESFDDTHYEDTLSNEYTIVRGKSFLFRGREYSETMHVCLGRVAYPIDYNILGLNSSDYRLPIALRLEVGDISVVASREQLDYSEATIKVLKKKLSEAKVEVTQMLAKQYENIVTLKDYFTVKNEFGTLRFSNGMSFSVGNLITQKDVDFSNFKYSFLKMPNDKQLYKFFFESKFFGKKTGRSRYNSSNNEFDGGYEALKRNDNLYYIEGEFIRKVAKQAYLKDLHAKYFIINRRNIAAGYIRSEVAELFNVHIDKTVDDNGKPTDFIQSLIDMQDEYWQIVCENASDYDKVEVPAEFMVRRKRNVLSSDEMRKMTIPVKLFGSWGKSRIVLDSLLKFNLPIFYGVQEDEDKLNTAYTLFKALFDKDCIVSRYWESNNTLYRSDSNPKKGIMFVMLSKGNVKYMEYCKKAVHIDQFYNKMLYRKADMVQEYFQTYNLVERYEELKDLYTNEHFSKINAKWGKVIKSNNKFINNLPNAKNSNLGNLNLKSELGRFFDLKGLAMSDEQKKFAKQVEELHQLQRKNSSVLGYINNYYYSGELDSTLVDILSKIMVF